MENLDINNDIEMKENNNEHPAKFIPRKLSEVMDKKYIIRRQKYTKQTFKIYKKTKDKYKKWLKKEIENETKLGIDLKNQIKHDPMNKGKALILPKYHLRAIHGEWDCDLPRIRDIITNFLDRDWSEWSDDMVSSEQFCIAEIIDPENPAKKYGADQGVHDYKAYGLFATQSIVKDSLIFEYAGCVKPVREASKKLDHVETELDQTTLFDLVGHLDKNRNKQFWGKSPNDQLVIDPSTWHNEGVYMNDYRENVLDDPDDSDYEDHEDSKQLKQALARKQNIKYYEVLVNDWPRVFAVALCDIQPGEELLGDYGEGFWSNFRLMIRRQSQLNEVKQRIHDQWQQKYDELMAKFNEQSQQIKELKEAFKNK